MPTMSSATTAEEIKLLREWLSKQPHLPEVSDLHLRMFLHSCRYSLERTKGTIDTYFTVRTHTPEIFRQRDPFSPEVQKGWDIIDMADLEKDSNGLKNVLVNLSDTDTSHFCFIDLLKLVFMSVDTILLKEPVAEGFVVILDFTGVTLGHLTKIPLGTLRKAFIYVQEGFPLRLTAVHILTSSSLIDAIMLLIKPFLNKELAGLLHFHSNGAEDLQQHISKDILPQDYGGNSDSVNIFHQALKHKVEKNRHWLLEYDKFKVDESKRMGPSKSGMEGSFKKLDID